MTDNGTIGFNGFDGGPMMMGMDPRFGMGHKGIVRGLEDLTLKQSS
jgi:hypothetical protein